MPLGAIPGGQNSPRKRSNSRGNMTKAIKPQTALKRKPEPKTRNAYHAQLEAKCGLVEVITLLYPHLEGEVAIGGEAFPCPLPMHLDGDTRTVKVTPGRKWDKPFWKCGAGCCKDKGNDTIDFIRSALGIPFPKAISLWAKLATAPIEKRLEVLRKSYLQFQPKGKAA